VKAKFGLLPYFSALSSAKSQSQLHFAMSLPEASRESVIHYVQSNLDSITFKSLKRDEKDTPDDVKLAVMAKTLVDDPGLFLTRWGRFLPQEELKHFEPLRGNEST
jgi:hypothetical protein